MGPQTEKLVTVLDRLIVLLESDEETHWCGWMRKIRARLINSDYSGIEYLLSAYGGMGSFNDLILAQTFVNGQFSWKTGHQQINDEFASLRAQAWELAQLIQRSHEIANA